MLDPDRNELIEFLESRYELVSGGETLHCEEDEPDGCGCRFDIEEAAYYVAAHYHGGQWSCLYSTLSQSEFRPGPISKDLPDDDERFIASALYREASAWIEEK